MANLIWIGIVVVLSIVFIYFAITYIIGYFVAVDERRTGNPDSSGTVPIAPTQVTGVDIISFSILSYEQ